MPLLTFSKSSIKGRAGKTISPTCNNLLIARKDLDLDRKLIVQFGQLAKRFFTGV